jgi:short-subunit dehydrogenase
MGQSIFITGGTTGIGLALAETYLKRGCRVGVCGRDLKKLDENFKRQFGQLLHTYEVDVTDLSELKNAVRDFVQKAGGSLDMMVANAGRSVGTKSAIPNFDDARDVLNINIMGVVNAFDAAMEFMAPAKKGHLVCIASVAGFVGLPGASAYSASKAAVLRYCESLSIDLKSQGIKVSAVCPGFIDTPLTRRNRHAMPFIMPAEEAAKRIVKAMDCGCELYVFPKRMKALIFILDKMPRWLYRKLLGFKFPLYQK